MAWPNLPKRAHYALQSLCCLASTSGPMHAGEVARHTGIPPAEAAKVLNLLAGGGFVLSRRGLRGGFWLRKSPRQILVGDLMKFLYPFVPDGPSEDDYVLHVWEKTAASSQEAFNRFSVADLMKEGHVPLGIRVSPKRGG